MHTQDKQWMEVALKEAQMAALRGEVPVGAVLTCENKLLSASGNSPISTNDPTAHAEIRAIRSACKTLGNYRLPTTTLYVTLEPCIMCLGAIIHARIDRLVFGAYDPKTGAIESTFRLVDITSLNHHIQYLGGILEDECSLLLKDFFLEKRRIKKHSALK